jgi:hypothetical protein
VKLRVGRKYDDDDGCGSWRVMEGGKVRLERSDGDMTQNSVIK